MTSEEFKNARMALGLTVRDVAHILDTNEKTVRLWERIAYDREPNPVAARVMQWMLDGYRPPEFAECALDQDLGAE